MDNLQHEEYKITDGTSAEHSAVQRDSMVTVRLSQTPPHSVVTLPTNSLRGEEFHKDPSSEIAGLGLEDVNGIAATDSSTMAFDPDEEDWRGNDSTADSEGEIDWEELEKTEEQEPRDQDSEDSTALLLARLEQENNLLVTNPKSGLNKVADADRARNRHQSRPPSIHQLKKLVNGPTPPALRYSLIPAPPMTDLEFYAALVQDYSRTAQRLPTLLSKKIRSGIPPPLRGVVWQSMSGARDRHLENEFDRLCGESSPYEGIIGKDLGRSFPGVEMFRDPEGDGQRMLGRVLKCFSLYDHKIGYCQGLGFLVGPLLMHMGDKQAFCVLVRLMECYDLRNCFLPDLSGLHIRIYQFRELLKRHLPQLSAHLERLRIEAGYVSQWFLSFFAVTCPLPMLFRIYDVIFAEGASETIMRVALSIMRMNEAKILAFTEEDDILQLLLSRGLWDCYHYNADDFVNDFVGLTGIVTNESLQALEASYKESKSSDVSLSSEIGSAASRFLGRLWSGSQLSAKTTNLVPILNTPSRPASFLFRSTSKQSLASTFNSAEGGTESTISASTEAVSRDSSNTDCSSIRVQSNVIAKINPSANGPNDESKSLNGQIEDLLMALSDMQREQAALATQLQKEREEREEDRETVRSLLGKLRNGSSETVASIGTEENLKPAGPSIEGETEGSVIETREAIDSNDVHAEATQERPELMHETGRRDLALLLNNVELRFARKDKRRSSLLQSKSQLREELARAKEQLTAELFKSQDLNQRLKGLEEELGNTRDLLKESHSYMRNARQDKQRLEKQIYDLRSRRTPVMSPADTSSNEGDWQRSSSPSTGGLRELRLGRTSTNLSIAPTSAKRSSSYNTQLGAGKDDSPTGLQTPPIVDTDSLLMELVQSKTAEAIAKQDAEEAKAKLESLRKLFGVNTSNADIVKQQKPSPGQPNMFSSYMDRMVESTKVVASSSAMSAMNAMSATSATGNGFWGGWGKKGAGSEPESA